MQRDKNSSSSIDFLIPATKYMFGREKLKHIIDCSSLRILSGKIKALMGCGYLYGKLRRNINGQFLAMDFVQKHTRLHD